MKKEEERRKVRKRKRKKRKKTINHVGVCAKKAKPKSPDPSLQLNVAFGEAQRCAFSAHPMLEDKSIAGFCPMLE